MKIICLSVFASLLSGAAFAGSLSTPMSEQEPAQAEIKTIQDVSWTGAYAGLQYGQGDAKASFAGFSLGADGDALGVHAGYLYDLGEYVLGGELSYDRLTADGVEGDTKLLRLRGIAGYDLGQFMPYATLGLARVSEEDVSETGITFGVGAEYRVTDNFGVGLEFSRSNFSDVDGVDGLDIDVDMIQLRTSFHF